MKVEVQKRRFTVAEYRLMAEAGIFHEDDRVELFEGEVIQMSPKGRAHSACVTRFNHFLVERLRGKGIVRVQDPFELDEYGEPEPDLVVARPRADFYAAGHPRPEDILLVVEVADSSIAYDRNKKIPAYAAAGIPEAWIADLTEHVLEVYRKPSAAGYQETLRLRSAEAVSPLAFPDCAFAVRDLLGV